jgi:nucleoside-diphosphate-sugar epimerase
MRVAITGATGNVGTSVLAALAEEPRVEEMVAIARRAPEGALAARAPEQVLESHAPERSFPRTRFVAADVARDDLKPIFAGAEAVVHLAWLIQPSRDRALMYRVNVTGSERVLAAAARAGVRTIVCASSIGTYSPGPKDRLVDESWPTDGIPSSFYSRHKAEVERLLDRLERDQPGIRVVRMRPALTFKADAATEIGRLFAGPLLPRRLLRPGLIPFVPEVRGLRFQAVHSVDVGDAYRRAVVSDARGAFNLAAAPPIGAPELAELLRARRVPLPPAVLRGAAAVTYALRLQPSEPGWVDMALGVPLIDSARARLELGWEPRYSSTDALLELLDGIRRGADYATPPLARGPSKGLCH